MDSKLFRKLAAVFLLTVGAVLLTIGLTVGNSDVYGSPNQVSSDETSYPLLCGTPWSPETTDTDFSDPSATTLTTYGVNVCKEPLGQDASLATALTILAGAALVLGIGFTIGAALTTHPAAPPEPEDVTLYPAVQEIAGHRLVTTRRDNSVFLRRRDVAAIIGVTSDAIDTQLRSRQQASFGWNDHGSGIPIPEPFIAAEAIPALVGAFPSANADALSKFTFELTGP